MLPPVKARAIAVLTALSLVASLAAAPALAWDRDKKNFAAGVATAVVVGTIINDIRRKERARQAPPQQYYPHQYHPQPYYSQQYYPPQRYSQPPIYKQPAYRHPPYRQPVYQKPVHAPVRSHQTSVYATPAARAFQSYTVAERKAIQRRLAMQGYYSSGIDGAFGPGTYSAVLAYARDTRMAESLQNTAGAYAVYDGLLF